MKRALFLLMAFVLLTLGRVSALAQPPAPEPAWLDRLHVGMTADEVRQLLGEPKSVGRQILFRRHLEQWVYADPVAVRIEFECLAGQESHVKTIRALPSR